ncbi:MAG: hypothetical protein ACTSP4_05725 [Candidatus Hodarchaeales archaeon]
MHGGNRHTGWNTREQNDNIDNSSAILKVVVVFLDLDNFKVTTERLGWTKHSPNPCTGAMSSLITEMTRKFNGRVLSGHDPVRGTEEAMILFNFVSVNRIEREIVRVQQEIAKNGVHCSLSAGIACTNSSDIEDITKVIKSAKKGKIKHPLLMMAKKQCRIAKKKGGNCIKILVL